MKTDLTLQITIENPPAGVDFGLQLGKGSRFQSVQTQRSGDGKLTFVCPVTVESDRASGRLKFSGHYVHGKPGAKFVYIDVGQAAGQLDSPWSRRIKVPIEGITQQLVETAANRGLVLKARIAGTAKDGGPACATCQPRDGWLV